MSEPGVKVRMSYAEYLSAEAQGEVKHQFVDGEMFAMAGGTRRHAYLQTRVVVALGNALRNRPCVPYGSELRVYLPALGEGTYPDASIVCGRFLRASEDPEATVSPAALVEVLSPTTEAYDRGRKFEKYQTLPSFREYLLVSQDRPRVERYVRGDDGSWIGVRMPRANACPLPARVLTSRSTISIRARSTPMMTPRRRRDPTLGGRRFDRGSRAWNSASSQGNQEHR